MHGRFAGEIAPLGMLDHVDFADQIGDRDIRRGEFLAIAIVATDPIDGSFRAHRGDFVFRFARDGRVGMVVDFRAGDDRQGVVEQVDQSAEHPRFGLAAKSEKKNVVSREDGVDDLRDDGFVIAEDIRKQRIAAPEFGDQVAAHLVLDRLHSIAALSQLADGSWVVPSPCRLCLRRLLRRLLNGRESLRWIVRSVGSSVSQVRLFVCGIPRKIW